MARIARERRRGRRQRNHDGARMRLEHAAAAYEALLVLEPDHYWAINNLMMIYRRIDRSDLAASLSRRFAWSRPNDARIQTLAAAALTALEGDLESASVFVRRARQVVAAGGTAIPRFVPGGISSMPTWRGFGTMPVRHAESLILSTRGCRR